MKLRRPIISQRITAPYVQGAVLPPPVDGRSPARRAAQRSTGVAVDDTHEALGVDRAEVARAPEGGDDLACLFLDGIGASRDGEGGA